jgi:hypothetical protein
MCSCNIISKTPFIVYNTRILLLHKYRVTGILLSRNLIRLERGSLIVRSNEGRRMGIQVEIRIAVRVSIYSYGFLRKTYKEMGHTVRDMRGRANLTSRGR